jgi:drug/metabolite transporter (DMT)-like permease
VLDHWDGLIVVLLLLPPGSTGFAVCLTRLWMGSFASTSALLWSRFSRSNEREPFCRRHWRATATNRLTLPVATGLQDAREGAPSSPASPMGLPLSADDTIVREQQQQGAGALKSHHDSTDHHQTNLTRRGLLLQLLSVCLFSVMGVFLKFAAHYDIPSSELVFLRATFQGVFVVAGLCLFRADGALHQGALGTRLIYYPFGGSAYCIQVVLVRGIVGAAGFCFAYYTLSVLDIGDAVATLSLYPIPTVLLGRFLLQEEISVLQLTSVVLSVGGAVLIAQPSVLFGGANESSSSSGRILGYVSGVLGSVMAAGVVTLIRKAGLIGAHTLQLLFSWVFFGVLFSGLGAFVQRWKAPPNGTCWWYILCMSVFGSMAHVLLNYAGRLVPAGASSIMRSTNIVWAYLWEVVIFHVHPGLLTWCGVFLIGTSLVMVALQQVFAERSGKGAATVSQEDETSVGSDDDADQDDDVELSAFAFVSNDGNRYVMVHGSDETNEVLDSQVAKYLS